MNKCGIYAIISFVLTSLACNASESKEELIVHDATEQQPCYLFDPQIVPKSILEKILHYCIYPKCSEIDPVKYVLNTDPNVSDCVKVRCEGRTLFRAACDNLLCPNRSRHRFRELLKFRRVSRCCKEKVAGNMIKLLIDKVYINENSGENITCLNYDSSACRLIYFSDPAITWRFTKEKWSENVSGPFSDCFLNGILLLTRIKPSASETLNLHEKYSDAFVSKFFDYEHYIPTLFGEDNKDFDFSEVPPHKKNEFILLSLLCYEQTIKDKLLYNAAWYYGPGKNANERMIFLLNNGANCNAIYGDYWPDTVFDRIFRNIVHSEEERVAKHSMIQKMFDKGFVGVNKRERYGQSFLELAMQNDDVEMMQLLLANGADPLLKNNIGYDLFEHALRQRKVGVVKLLIASGKIDKIDSANYHPWPEEQKIYANSDETLGIIRFLIEHKIDPTYFFKISLWAVTGAFATNSYPHKYLTKLDADEAVKMIECLLKNNVKFSDIDCIHDWAKGPLSHMHGNEKAIALAHKYGPKLS